MRYDEDINERAGIFKNLLIFKFGLAEKVGSRIPVTNITSGDLQDNNETIDEVMTNFPNGFIKYSLKKITNENRGGKRIREQKEENRAANRFGMSSVVISKWFRWLVNHSRFDLVYAIVVIWSMASVFLETEYGRLRVSDSTNIRTVRSIIVNNYGISQWVLALLLVFEVVAKWFADFSAYWKSFWNILDFLVVVITTPFLGEITGWYDVPYFGEMFPTAVRTLVALKLVHKLNAMKAVFELLALTMRSMVYVIGFIILMTYIFGLIGTFLFDMHNIPHSPFSTYPDEERFTEKEYWEPQYVFSAGIGRAVLTVFKLFTLDGWYRFYKGFVQHHDSASAVLFIFSWVFLSAFLLGNLFPALLITNFQRIRSKLLEDIKFIEAVNKISQEIVMLGDTIENEKRRSLDFNQDLLNEVESLQQLEKIIDGQKLSTNNLQIPNLESLQIPGKEKGIVINDEYNDIFVGSTVSINPQGISNASKPQKPTVLSNIGVVNRPDQIPVLSRIPSQIMEGQSLELDEFALSLALQTQHQIKKQNSESKPEPGSELLALLSENNNANDPQTVSGKKSAIQSVAQRRVTRNASRLVGGGAQGSRHHLSPDESRKPSNPKLRSSSMLTSLNILIPIKAKFKALIRNKSTSHRDIQIEVVEPSQGLIAGKESITKQKEAVEDITLSKARALNMQQLAAASKTKESLLTSSVKAKLMLLETQMTQKGRSLRLMKNRDDNSGLIPSTFDMRRHGSSHLNMKQQFPSFQSAEWRKHSHAHPLQNQYLRFELKKIMMSEELSAEKWIITAKSCLSALKTVEVDTAWSEITLLKFLYLLTELMENIMEREILFGLSNTLLLSLAEHSGTVHKLQKRRRSTTSRTRRLTSIVSEGGSISHGESIPRNIQLQTPNAFRTLRRISDLVNVVRVKNDFKKSALKKN